MGGDSAKIASSETTPVGVYGELYHVVRRDPFPLVPGMRQFGEGKVPERIHLLLGRRRIRGIYLDVSVTDGFHDGGRMHHVGVGLDEVEVLSESLLAFPALLIGMEHQRVLHFGSPFHEESYLGYLVHLMEGSSRLNAPGEFQHGSLPHPVAKVIRPAAYKNRRHEVILPPVVMGESPE